MMFALYCVSVWCKSSWGSNCLLLLRHEHKEIFAYTCMHHFPTLQLQYVMFTSTSMSTNALCCASVSCCLFIELMFFTECTKTVFWQIHISVARNIRILDYLWAFVIRIGRHEKVLTYFSLLVSLVIVLIQIKVQCFSPLFWFRLDLLPIIQEISTSTRYKIP